MGNDFREAISHHEPWLTHFEQLHLQTNIHFATIEMCSSGHGIFSFQLNG
jgi:hypothetical protein